MNKNESHKPKLSIHFLLYGNIILMIISIQSWFEFIMNKMFNISNLESPKRHSRAIDYRTFII